MHGPVARHKVRPELLLVGGGEDRGEVKEPVEEERRRPESDQMPATSPAKASRPLHAVPDYAVRGDRVPREDLLKSAAAKGTRVVREPPAYPHPPFDEIGSKGPVP